MSPKNEEICVAIIPARGGSKGIPGKNLVPLLDKPLLAWSIEHALASSKIQSVWVTSDDDEILDVAKSFGAKAILRPENISGDGATSESAWLHALDYIEHQNEIQISMVVGMQATSPIRGDDDLDEAITIFNRDNLDSLCSVTPVEDHNQWRRQDALVVPINGYDYKNRKRRQDLEVTYLENGSFYIFTPSSFRKYNNRLSGKIGFYEQKIYKMFQIDNQSDIDLCSAILEAQQKGKI